MTPASFRLYDIFNLAATAVDADGSGRPAEAEAAWVEALYAANGLFAPGSDADVALAAIFDAVFPPLAEAGAQELWNALDAAAQAALIAMTGDGPQTALLLNDLEGAANALSAGLCDAMMVLAGEIGCLAMTGVAA